MHLSRRRHLPWLVFVMLLAALPSAPVAAQDNPPPIAVELPCATNVSVQVLGRLPIPDTTQDLVQVRIIWGPGGSIGAHTHPGIMWVVVESGTLGFTLLDDSEMSITRSARADREASQEPLTQDVEVALEAGDGFPEMGMAHSARNLSDETTTTVFSGLVEQGQPLTSCVDDATPMAVAHH